MYLADQIKIPPQLPEVMKDFTKAAIRAQADAQLQQKDMLEWSREWFEKKIAEGKNGE